MPATGKSNKISLGKGINISIEGVKTNKPTNPAEQMILSMQTSNSHFTE